jgi:uncharacterized protein
MKKYWLIGACILALAGAIFLSGCQGGTTTINGLSSQQQGIMVTGEGDVMATPDIFNLSLGVQAEETTVEQAQAEAVAAMNKVIDTLKSNGIDDNDIQTQNFSISPVTKWDQNRQESVTTGYQVSNMVIVKVRDIDKAGEIIDAVALAGGDLVRVNSMGFSIDDPSEDYDMAREEAMADAFAKAQQLARLANVTLGKPTFISEQVQYTPPIIYRDFSETASAPSAAQTPISAGELEINASVQITYAIVP